MLFLVYTCFNHDLLIFLQTYNKHCVCYFFYFPGNILINTEGRKKKLNQNLKTTNNPPPHYYT